MIQLFFWDKKKPTNCTSQSWTNSLEIYAQFSRAINLTRKHTWCILFFTKSMILITHFFIFLNLFHSQLPVNFKRSIPSSYSSFFFVYFSAKTWHTSKAKFKWKFRTLLFVPFFLPVNNSNLPKPRRCNNKLWKFILEFLQTPWVPDIIFYVLPRVQLGRGSKLSSNSPKRYNP